MELEIIFDLESEGKILIEIQRFRMK